MSIYVSVESIINPRNIYRQDNISATLGYLGLQLYVKKFSLVTITSLRTAEMEPIIRCVARNQIIKIQHRFFRSSSCGRVVIQQARRNMSHMSEK